MEQTPSRRTKYQTKNSVCQRCVLEKFATSTTKSLSSVRPLEIYVQKHQSTQKTRLPMRKHLLQGMENPLRAVPPPLRVLPSGRKNDDGSCNPTLRGGNAHNRKRPSSLLHL